MGKADVPGRDAETQDVGIPLRHPRPPPARRHAVGGGDVPGRSSRRSPARPTAAFRLVGNGAHDLVAAGQAVQGDFFGDASPDGKVERALNAVRERSRGFGTSGGGCDVRSDGLG